LGGVLDNEEIRKTLVFAFEFCARAANIPETAWGLLEEIIKFMSQQGRLDQPWGIECVSEVDQPEQTQPIEVKERKSFNKMADQMKEDVYVVLSSYERATVRSIQKRKPGATPINWKAMAEDLKVSQTYL
jgi:hypothetical protein